jgi:adenosylcobyric acid synthase
MNPVLLKPESDTGAQVILQGRRLVSAEARDYAALKPRLLDGVLDSFPASVARHDLIVVEGAGARLRSTCAGATSPTWASRARRGSP